MEKKNEPNWLGIYPDGRHDTVLTSAEKRCIDTLKNHVGMANPASAAYLADMVIGVSTRMQATRKLRLLVNHLIINHDIPVICQAGIGGGYWLPGSKDEVEHFHRAFRKRAMTGLIKACRGKKAAFVDMVTQLTIEFDQETGQGVQAPAVERLKLVPDPDPIPASVQVITAQLRRYHDEPEKFAAEIRQIQEDFGEVLMPRDHLRKLKRATARLQNLLADVV